LTKHRFETDSLEVDIGGSGTNNLLEFRPLRAVCPIGRNPLETSI
jgi:hypothetical protein